MILDSFVPRRVSGLLKDLVKVEPVIALHGPRSVGKSTVLRGVAAECGSSGTAARILRCRSGAGSRQSAKRH